MSDAALTGLPDDFAFGGLTYKVAPRTLGAECLFQTWLERQALEALQRHRAALGDADYAEARRDWARDCAAKAYSWGKPLCHQAAFSPPGLQYLAYLKINEGAERAKGAPRIGEEQVAAVAADAEAWGRLVDLMMRQDYPEAWAEANKKEGGEGAAPNPPGPA